MGNDRHRTIFWFRRKKKENHFKEIIRKWNNRKVTLKMFIIEKNKNELIVKLFVHN